ncbi:MAG: hypothetical protein SNG97_06370 [Rikenellaceae bacterium]
MERQQIITELKIFFGISELCCPHVTAKWGATAWQFLSTEFLHTLLIVRKNILKAPMMCNGGSYTQRGLRCNCCSMVQGKTTPYLSAHVLGCGADFTVSGISAEAARELIKANQHLLPCEIRIEGGVTWLHIDTMHQDPATKVKDRIHGQVYEFQV